MVKCTECKEQIEKGELPKFIFTKRVCGKCFNKLKYISKKKRNGIKINPYLKIYGEYWLCLISSRCLKSQSF